MAMMTDSNSSSSTNPFTFPNVLEFHTSASNCSLDVSVLSVDSSCSSFGSMSQLQVDRTAGRKKVHKKRPSYAKFNQYKGGSAGSVSIGGRWNNTVDAFGSAGMNTAPFRKPSYNRLSNPKLNQRMSVDASAEMPYRKFSDNDMMKLSQHKPLAADVADGPISVPVRQDSGSVESGSSDVSERSDNRATAALYKQFRRSSKAKNKNFQWTRTRPSTGSTKGPQLLNARTCPPMVESTFRFDLPKPAGAPQHHLMNTLKKKNPPAKPSRKGSIMEFNILNDFEDKEQPRLPSFPRKNNTTMMPPPARKPSLMDFDDLSSNGSSGHLAGGQILPLPGPSTNMNFNSSWSSSQWQHQTNAPAATAPPMGSHSDPCNGLLGSTRTSPQDLFLAMPPLTKFERHASCGTTPTVRTSITSASHRSHSTSPPPMPRRREGFADTAAVPGLMPMMIPGPPTFNRQSSSVSQAPSVPQRKDSLMSINGDSEL